MEGASATQGGGEHTFQALTSFQLSHFRPYRFKPEYNYIPIRVNATAAPCTNADPTTL